jgi:hypothetical protein
MDLINKCIHKKLEKQKSMELEILKQQLVT